MNYSNYIFQLARSPAGYLAVFCIRYPAGRIRYPAGYKKKVGLSGRISDASLFAGIDIYTPAKFTVNL
jgi:hypothetical protein